MFTSALHSALFVLVGVLFVAACQNGDEGRSSGLEEPAFRKDGTLAFVRPDGTVLREIDIEIAEDQSARTTGLMYRRQMTLGQGMLFRFPAPDDLQFWMKNTPMPLDIIFVGPDSQIVNIIKRTRPLSEDPVRSTGPAQFVVEVRGGFSDRYGLTDSLGVHWQRTAPTN